MILNPITILFFSLLVVALFRISSLWFLSIGYSFRKAKPPETARRASVIVPAFNEERTIEACINSLIQQDYPDYEVVVVDDGSSDETLEVARKLEGHNVKVIHQENRGKAEALNTGIGSSSGSLILTVDADTRLNPSALRNLSARFGASPKLGALAGNVKIFEAKGLLQRLQEVEYATGIGLTRRGQSMLSSVMIVPGPIAAFRKEAIEQVKGFSSDTFAEDFDITLAILKSHFKAEYEDSAIAYTLAPHGVEDLVKQRRRWYRGMMQVLAKHEDMFLRPKYGAAGLYGVPYVWFDTFSPVINLFLAVFGVIAGFVTGDWITILIGLSAYWLLQTLLVVTAVLLDKERRLRQILLSPLLFFYNTFMDGLRTAAFVEELLSLRMKWEKPRR